MTTPRTVGIVANMKAGLITRFRDIADDGTGLEMVVWRVPDPVPPSGRRFKYRLVYVESGRRVVGFDNERGKGDHKHFGDQESFDLATPAGTLMLTMLAAVAELERENLKARQLAGLERTKAEGKVLGRSKSIDDAAVVAWRAENSASITATAEHFGISAASVKQACAKR